MHSEMLLLCSNLIQNTGKSYSKVSGEVCGSYFIKKNLIVYSFAPDFLLLVKR